MLRHPLKVKNPKKSIIFRHEWNPFNIRRKKIQYFDYFCRTHNSFCLRNNSEIDFMKWNYTIVQFITSIRVSHAQIDRNRGGNATLIAIQHIVWNEYFYSTCKSVVLSSSVVLFWILIQTIVRQYICYK